MNWLITGGCGFLGTALIQRLIEQGNHVIRMLDNPSTGTRGDPFMVTEYNEPSTQNINGAPNGVELVVGDILDEKLAIQVVQGCDILVHFSANTGVSPSVQNPRADMLAIVVGIFNHLEAASVNQVKRFIFSSSGAPRW